MKADTVAAEAARAKTQDAFMVIFAGHWVGRLLALPRCGESLDWELDAEMCVRVNTYR